MRVKTAILLLLLGALTTGCEEVDDPVDGVPALVIDYPFDGTIFPPDFVAPTFLWHDPVDEADTWRVTLSSDEDTTAGFAVLVPGAPLPELVIDHDAVGETNEIPEYTPYEASARSWRPSPDQWEEIKRRAARSPATLTLVGLQAAAPDVPLSRGTLTLKTAATPVGAPVFYRDVPLLPALGDRGVIQPLGKGNLPLIAWRLRDVSQRDSRVVLKGLPSCANCHSFSRDGKTLGMDVDDPQGDKGAYALVPVSPRIRIERDDVLTWNAFPDKPKDHKTLGFLSRVSPDGRFVVSTLNEDLYVSNFTDYRFLQVFFPTRGILAWYARETGEMKALPGADDPEFVHCDPVWTPDGETLVFARAPARDPYEEGRPLAQRPNDPNEPEIRYDLYRMPFNEGRGGVPEPIRGAADNGMSNTFPKVSPDGKWIVFVKCRNGQLLRPDGKLWIVPTEGGEARELECNLPLMNSWHSFSPNGRWLVWSSKAFTPYTQMFLTHLDEAGHASPAILIPNSTAANRAVNLPEFLNAPYDALLSIEVPAVDHYYPFGDAAERIAAGEYERAVVALQETLERDPTFSRAHVDLSLAFLELGRLKEAIHHAERALALNPASSVAHNNLGLALERSGDPERAQEHYEAALRLSRWNHLAEYNLGLLHQSRGELRRAQQHLERATDLRPDFAEGHNSLGYVHHQLGDATQAIAHYRRAVALDPDLLVARRNLAFAFFGIGDLDTAAAEYARVLEGTPGDARLHQSLGLVLCRKGDAERGHAHLLQAVELGPEDVGLLRGVAWLLATAREEAVRDPARAVTLAEKAASLPGGQAAGVLDTLAVAYAAAGRYPEAVRAADRAIARAAAAPAPVRKALEARRALFRAGRPYRSE